MSITITTDNNVPFSQRNFAVSSNLLLALYAVVPLSILLALVDQWFLSGVLRDEYLPTNPSTLIWWAIIFNFPHIVSSLVTLADEEYIKFYKARFIKALLVITAGVFTINFIVPQLLPGQPSLMIGMLFFVFFSAYTMYHVLSQQFGIGMMLMKVRPTKQYEAWRWLATLATTIMYAMVFAKWGDKPFMNTPFSFYQWLGFAAGFFIVLSVIQGFYLTLGSQRQLGTWYVYSNLLMMICTYALLMMGYQFFVIAIPRFVHDLTAFIIYSTHDQNRNRQVRRNYIYRWLKFIPIPVMFLCPLLAIALAHSVQCGSFYIDLFLGFDEGAKAFNECPLTRFYEPTGENNGLPVYMQLWAQIMFICGFFHYYIEAFVWKREAIHRHSVSFT
jgi:hypothetical protein